MSAKGVIQENTETGQWEVLVDGNVIAKTKTLAWVKCNMRKNRKVLESGVREFEVHEDGKVTTFKPWDTGSKKVKAAVTALVGTPASEPESAPAQPPIRLRDLPPTEVETPEVSEPEGEMVILEGLEKLEGNTATGRVISKDGKKKIITVEVKTKNGESVIFEFNTRSGIQKTENPYHKWRIVKSA